jgi:lipopolysaccharide/colanic/teichoic acid biosynthesis glycosyltransferase
VGLNELVSAELATKASDATSQHARADAQTATQPVGAPAQRLERWLYRQLGRMRFQIAGGFAVGVLAPSLVRWGLEFWPDQAASYDNSLIGTTMAFLFGYLIFRKLTAFPGVRATGYVLPAFLVAYAIVVAYFFMLRLDYSRYQFLASFILTVGFFYLVFQLARRGQKPILSVIPVGDVGQLSDVSFVRWRTLDAPDGQRDKTPVVVDLSVDLPDAWDRFVADCALAGRPVYNAKHVMESLTGRVQIQHLSENTFGSLAPSLIYASAKRYIDVALAVVALLFLWPLLFAVAIAIRLESPGPAIFRQVRMGYRGETFTMWKFRSMRELNDPKLEGVDGDIKVHEARRITPIGHWIRRLRIDEVPQIVNILKGEMSWIGPRPEALALSHWYESKIPFYRYRHVVRPGLTGWAQVNQGHVVGVEDADRKLQYDFFYVKHFSLWLDMLVLLRTARVILTGHGAR